MKEVATILNDRFKSVVNSMGYEFVGCEWQQQGRHAVLRVYIDSQSGITLTDCSRVSHQLSAMLDVEGLIERQYLLEVSSPGIDRPLFEIAHYQKQVGQRVKIRVKTPMENRRNWVGTLMRVDDEQIHLLVSAVEIVIPFSNIERANVIADIEL